MDESIEAALIRAAYQIERLQQSGVMLRALLQDCQIDLDTANTRIKELENCIQSCSRVHRIDIRPDGE
jgi:hypothetical protein